MKKIFCILFLFPTLLVAQQNNLPLNREWGLIIDKQKNYIDSGSVQKKSPNEFSCFNPGIASLTHQKKSKSKFWPFISRKIRKESLVIVNDTADKFYLTIDPLFNFEFGKDFADSTGEKLYKNTRGFLVRGDIGKKISFESSFYENQATFPQYIDDYIKSTNDLFSQKANYFSDVIPGQGRAKRFKHNGYDYAMASGYVSYTPLKILNIQVGNGKHFVGDGYRSLLLSDNAFNYPYARITTTYKNIQYTNLYTSFMNLTDGGVKTPPNVERLFQKKTASYQLLSMNFFKRLQLGLFQGMVWEAADSTNRQYVNFNTFDPVIGVNTAIYGLDNKNNVLVGTTIKLKITNSISLYAQGLLDDIDNTNIKNKYGYQIGFKYFDLFTVKKLHIQLEYNSVRPYTYASENPEQSYSHYNQPLAHPLGANFWEAVGFINYRLKDFFIEIKANYAIKGQDSLNTNYGGTIFKSDKVFPITQQLDNIHTTQGLKATIMYQDIHVGYLVNPSTNFNIVLGISNRIFKTGNLTTNTQFVYIGMRTSLANFYYDF